MNYDFDTIVRVDLDTRQIVATFDFPAHDLQQALAETADASALLARTSGITKLIIDPDTGAVAGQVDPTPGGISDDGLAGSTGVIYASSYSARAVEVYDAAGNVLRTMPVNCGPEAIASGFYTEYAHRFTIAMDEQTSGIDFGVRNVSSSVSGVQFEDLDGDGIHDAGEPGAEGATVFVDLNDNPWPDANEPTAISGADGSYTLSTVPPGNNNLRSIAPEHFRPNDAVAVGDRLFGVRGDTDIESPTGQSYLLYELDPTDGSIVAQFRTSILATFKAAFAFDGERLILVNSDTDMLYELALDGAVMDSRPLGEPDGVGGFTPVVDYGPVAIGGTIFTVRAELNSLSRYRYDPDTKEFQSLGPLSFDWLQTDPPTTGLVNEPYAYFAASASADGQSIILASSNDRVLTIDPVTRYVVTQRRL